MIGPLRARTTLEDAELAARLFQCATDAPSRRVAWIATMALLRAIGHVLWKVDREQDPLVTSAIEEHWTAVKEIERDRHGIFWNFIEPQRNAALKTYEFGHDDSDLERLTAVDAFRPYRAVDLTLMPALTDTYDGADARELIREALEWWGFQLVRIEQLISDRWTQARRT